MKIIKMNDTVYDIQSMYDEANTPNQRALLGYILKRGLTQSAVCGGAFKLLCDIESCVHNREIYVIENESTSEISDGIFHIAQRALNREYKGFKIRKAEIRKMLKVLAKEVDENA